MTDRAMLEGLRVGEPWAVDRLYRDHAARVLRGSVKVHRPRDSLSLRSQHRDPRHQH